MADRYSGTGNEPVERRFKSFDKRIRAIERANAQGAPVRLSRQITVVEGDLVALEVRVAANELSIQQINLALAGLDARITDLENALASLGFQSLIDTPDTWGNPGDLVVINPGGDGLIYMAMPNFVLPDDLAAVAFSGDYEDLINTPPFGTMAFEDTSSYTPTSGLAPVALSNDYDDLDNLPTLGTMAAEDASNYTPTSGLADVALSGDYNDLINTPGPGVTSFLGLSDTPANYSGAALMAVRVNAGGTALEFTAFPVGAGDVVGPAGATDENFVIFDGATGKLIKDAGFGPDDLATVAFTGDYGDLDNPPTLGTMAAEDASSYTPTSGLAAVALSNDYEDLDNLPTLGTMAAEDASSYTPTSGLAAVALSNDYEDLDNLPTLGTMAAESAGDYTPTSGLAPVALSNDYEDLDNLPTLGTMAAEDASNYTPTSGLSAVALSNDYGDLDNLPSLVTAFLGLSDTPAAYTGAALMAVRVNAGATALEFVAFPTGTGDVVGPASSVLGNLASFGDTTGKLIADSGIPLTNVIQGFPILAPDGGFSTPSYSFATNTSTGMYRTGAGSIAFVVDGDILAFHVGGANPRSFLAEIPGSVTVPTISLNSDNNTGIYFPGADQIAVATGGTAAMIWFNDLIQANRRLRFNGSYNAPLTSDASPAIYRTTTAGGAGPFPFNGTGHLVIQSRSDAANHIVFMVGTTPTPALTITSDGLILAEEMGTASAPVISLRGDQDTGVFFPAANQVALAAGGGQARLVASAVAVTSNVQFIRALSALTPTTGTVNIDLLGVPFRTLAISGNVTFTFSNLAAGRKVTLRIHNTSGATRSINWPANTKLSAEGYENLIPIILWQDPTQILNNRGMVIDIISWAANATNVTASVVAAYAL